MMDYRKIAIAAIREEANKKPDKKIHVSSLSLTYSEIANLAEAGDKLVDQFFVKPYMKQLKEVPSFRARILSMLGMEDTTK